MDSELPDMSRMVLKEIRETIIRTAGNLSAADILDILIMIDKTLGEDCTRGES